MEDGNTTLMFMLWLFHRMSIKTNSPNGASNLNQLVSVKSTTLLLKVPEENKLEESLTMFQSTCVKTFNNDVLLSESIEVGSLSKKPIINSFEGTSLRTLQSNLCRSPQGKSALGIASFFSHRNEQVSPHVLLILAPHVGTPLFFNN